MKQRAQGLCFLFVADYAETVALKLVLSIVNRFKGLSCYAGENDCRYNQRRHNDCRKQAVERCIEWI